MQNAVHLIDAMEEPGSSHVLDYSMLVILLALGIFGLSVIAQTKEMQFEAIMLTVLAYVIWGIHHHTVEHTLTWEILLEFFSFAAFIFIVLLVAMFLV